MEERKPAGPSQEIVDLTKMFVYVGAFECAQATGRITNGNLMLVSLSTEAGPADSLIIDIDCISNCLDQIRQAQGRASK